MLFAMAALAFVNTSKVQVRVGVNINIGVTGITNIKVWETIQPRALVRATIRISDR